MTNGMAAATMPLVLVGLGFAVIFAGCAAPYVIHTALEYTAQVTSQTSINGSQAAKPVSFYLDAGSHYNFYILQQPQTGETFAVVTTLSVPVGSLVFVNSTEAQWFVTSTSPPISGVNVPQNYDRLILATSIRVVPQPLSGYESYLAQDPTGRLLTELSSASLVLPLAFVLIARVMTKRWSLWSFVIAAWFLAMLFFATDTVGSGYGQAASVTLEAALAGLPVIAYITSRIETRVRARLAAQSRAG
jgi:hypothetical protein